MTMIKNRRTYETYFLPWDEVAQLLEAQIYRLLGKRIELRVWQEDFDYWGCQAKEYYFSFEELNLMLDEVHASPKVRENTLPGEEATQTKSFGMDLGRQLLLISLQSDWENEKAEEDGLWIIGVISDAVCPYTKSGLLHRLDPGHLMSKDGVLTYLYENGCTDRALSHIREQYLAKFGNELCWKYPISDGMHLGTFILVVKEGYLSLPYDSAEKEEYEILEPRDASMHDADSLSAFLSDWKSFSDDLVDAMREMRSILMGGTIDV